MLPYAHVSMFFNKIEISWKVDIDLHQLQNYKIITNIF
jgi:hypothetical protein